METNHVNRQASSASRLVGVFLFVAVVAVACGRSTSGQGTLPGGADPVTVASPVAATLDPASTPVMPDVSASPAASDSAAPVATYSPPSTANDPVTGEMQSIDQLLKGIDGSLSGADPGTTGGE